MNQKLWRFPGGLRLPGFKAMSTREPLERAPIPAQLILPLRQHIGSPAKSLVVVGDRVAKGQMLAAPTAFISAAVHAPTSGRIIAIGDHGIPHPSGAHEPCLVLASDGEDRWHEACNVPRDPGSMSDDALRDVIRAAGVVGLGGAVFPSAAKLKPTRAIETLIINGAECEPYITCDDVLMRMRAADVVHGSRLLRRTVGATRCVIAVEDNKPLAAHALREAIATIQSADQTTTDVEVLVIPTIFPAGGERQLIKVITGREIGRSGLPYEVGVVCLNVGTAVAVYDAAYLSRPLISRVVTVTGEAVSRPRNFEVLLGTPVADLIEAAGGYRDGRAQVIMGGPMMGFALPDDRRPIVKASNCILVKPVAEIDAPSTPCIRCGACAAACPVKLLPQQLYWYARAKDLPQVERHKLAECIECGCCAAVCPAHIPLVQYFRFAKSEIKDRARPPARRAVAPAQRAAPATARAPQARASRGTRAAQGRARQIRVGQAGGKERGRGNSRAGRGTRRHQRCRGELASRNHIE